MTTMSGVASDSLKSNDGCSDLYMCCVGSQSELVADSPSLTSTATTTSESLEKECPNSMDRPDSVHLAVRPDSVDLGRPDSIPGTLDLYPSDMSVVSEPAQASSSFFPSMVSIDGSVSSRYTDVSSSVFQLQEQQQQQQHDGDYQKLWLEAQHQLQQQLDERLRFIEEFLFGKHRASSASGSFSCGPDQEQASSSNSWDRWEQIRRLPGMNFCFSPEHLLSFAALMAFKEEQQPSLSWCPFPQLQAQLLCSQPPSTLVKGPQPLLKMKGAFYFFAKLGIANGLLSFERSLQEGSKKNSQDRFLWKEVGKRRLFGRSSADQDEAQGWQEVADEEEASRKIVLFSLFNAGSIPQGWTLTVFSADEKKGICDAKNVYSWVLCGLRREGMEEEEEEEEQQQQQQQDGGGKIEEDESLALKRASTDGRQSARPCDKERKKSGHAIERSDSDGAALLSATPAGFREQAPPSLIVSHQRTNLGEGSDARIVSSPNSVKGIDPDAFIVRNAALPQRGGHSDRYSEGAARRASLAGSPRVLSAARPLATSSLSPREAASPTAAGASPAAAAASGVSSGAPAGLSDDSDGYISVPHMNSAPFGSSPLYKRRYGVKTGAPFNAEAGMPPVHRRSSTLTNIGNDDNDDDGDLGASKESTHGLLGASRRGEGDESLLPRSVQPGRQTKVLPGSSLQKSKTAGDLGQKSYLDAFDFVWSESDSCLGEQKRPDGQPRSPVRISQGNGLDGDSYDFTPQNALGTFKAEKISSLPPVDYAAFAQKQEVPLPVEQEENKGGLLKLMQKKVTRALNKK